MQEVDAEGEARGKVDVGLEEVGVEGFHANGAAEGDKEAEGENLERRIREDAVADGAGEDGLGFPADRLLVAGLFDVVDLVDCHLDQEKPAGE